LPQLKKFLQFGLGLLFSIALAKYEPLMEKVAGLEENHHSQEQKDEEVVEKEFGMGLERSKPMNIKVDQVSQ
jgi:hypothetical protein